MKWDQKFLNGDGETQERVAQITGRLMRGHRSGTGEIISFADSHLKRGLIARTVFEGYIPVDFWQYGKQIPNSVMHYAKQLEIGRIECIEDWLVLSGSLVAHDLFQRPYVEINRVEDSTHGMVSVQVILDYDKFACSKHDIHDILLFQYLGIHDASKLPKNVVYTAVFTWLAMIVAAYNAYRKMDFTDRLTITHQQRREQAEANRYGIYSNRLGNANDGLPRMNRCFDMPLVACRKDAPGHKGISSFYEDATCPMLIRCANYASVLEILLLERFLLSFLPTSHKKRAKRDSAIFGFIRAMHGPMAMHGSPWRSWADGSSYGRFSTLFGRNRMNASSMRIDDTVGYILTPVFDGSVKGYYNDGPSAFETQLAMVCDL